MSLVCSTKECRLYPIHSGKSLNAFKKVSDTSRCEKYFIGSNVKNAWVELGAKTLVKRLMRQYWQEMVSPQGSGNGDQERRNLILWECFPVAWVNQSFNFYPHLLCLS